MSGKLSAGYSRDVCVSVVNPRKIEEGRRWRRSVVHEVEEKRADLVITHNDTC